MRSETLLLRFDNRLTAMTVLGTIGIEPDAIAGEGIGLEPTGETAEFEGEVLELTRSVSGYYVGLVWHGDIPCVLAPYLVTKGSGSGLTPLAPVPDT